MQSLTRRSNKVEKYSSPNILSHINNEPNLFIQQKQNKNPQDKNFFINQSKKNQNRVNQLKNNELQDFIALLQNIEETLGENGLQYLSRVQEHLEKLKIEYPNLKKLINLMFNQNKEEPKTQKDNLEQKQIDDDGFEKLKKYNKILKMSKIKLQQELGEISKKLNEQEMMYKKEQQKISTNQKKIEDYNSEIINKNQEIKDLKKNIENLKIQMENKDEIFQKTLIEAKNTSANALQEIAFKLEIRNDQIISVEKIHNDKLKDIKQNEKGIQDQTLELNKKIDECLKFFKQNPQSQNIQKEKISLEQKCENIKNLIKNSKDKLDSFINQFKNPWGGQFNKNEVNLKLQLQKNLELLNLYQKVFDNFSKTIMNLLENSCQYQQNNQILTVKLNNSICSVYLQNDNASNKNIKQLYASIKTEHHDTTLLKDNQSQTINDASFDSNDFQDSCYSRSRSPNKIKKRQNCLTESKQSIYGKSQIKQYIDSNN